jgi:hypothetical protein
MLELRMRRRERRSEGADIVTVLFRSANVSFKRCIANG